MTDIIRKVDKAGEWDSGLTPDRLSLTRADVPVDPVGALLHLSLTVDERPGHQSLPGGWLSLASM